MSHKAPSAGAKVTAGENAPRYDEPAGAVPQDSLAAESYREGGSFAANRGAQPDSRVPPTVPHEGGSGAQHQSGSAHAASQAGVTSSGQGASAPSYVSAQYVKDPRGPHGKNVHEAGPGEFEGTSYGNPNPDPGAADDPARAAELGFEKSQVKAAGDTGPRQMKADDRQPYGALNSDASA